MIGGIGTASRPDWTLLLPLDEPVDDAVVTGPDAEATGRQLVELGLAHRWRSVCTDGPPAGLVVARAPAAMRIEDLAATVAPGGILYAEADRSAPHGLFPGRRARDCERAGLEVVGSYWATPDVTATRRYVPIDCPAAVAWHLRTLVVPDSPLGRFAVGTTIAALTRTPRWGSALVRAACDHGVVVARRPDGTPMGGTTRRLVLTSGHDIGSRSVVVLFEAGEPRPTEVVKVAMRPDAVLSTIRERRRLRALHAILPGALAAGLPVPRRATETLHGVAFAETEVPGRTLQALAGEWGRSARHRIADLRRAVDWLVGLSLATAQSHPVPAPWTVVLDRYVAECQPSDRADALVRSLAARARTSPVCHRSVHVHGDPGPWNVYLDGDAVSVIDWEVGADSEIDARGAPLVDVIYLVTYWYLLVTRRHGADDEAEAVVSLLVDESSDDSPRSMTEVWAAVARSAIERAARRCGVDTADIPLLTVVLWAGQAVDARRRAASLGLPTSSVPTAAETYLEALAAALPEEVTAPCPARSGP